jgi:hypothetical protein
MRLSFVSIVVLAAVASSAFAAPAPRSSWDLWKPTNSFVSGSGGNGGNAKGGNAGNANGGSVINTGKNSSGNCTHFRLLLFDPLPNCSRWHIASGGDGGTSQGGDAAGGNGGNGFGGGSGGNGGDANSGNAGNANGGSVINEGNNINNSGGSSEYYHFMVDKNIDAY